MRIAIDTQTILGQKSGFGFYVKNLVDSLKKVDPENEYVLIAPETEKDFSTPQRLIWDQFQFPKIARQKQVDILHQPCFSAPMFYRSKIVVTCHDIISVKFPQNLPLASRLFYSKWMTFSYKAADAVITDAEHTKNDIIEYLKMKPEKIFVIPLAVSSDFQPVMGDQVQRTAEKYGIKGKYFIHVGTLEPRKNLEFLVCAFALTVKAGIEENLVITGKKGWYFEGLFALVKKMKLEDRVIFSGYGADEDMPALYSGATAMTFPSIYEGFGFPPLEAMACGTPVISSNTSSLPEVVGEAGILLAPENEQMWADKMIEVSRNANLRQRMKADGLNQAKKFSWDETAKKTIEVYKKVYQGKK